MLHKKRIQTIKAAPIWKRILSYILDSIFLFALLVIFVAGIYGNDLIQLLDNINKYGALDIIRDDSSFPKNMIDSFSQLTSYEQNMAYWMYLVQNKYSHSIFLLSQIISVLYFSLFWWSTGQTIGGRLLKIRVISPLNERIPLFSLLIRITTFKLVEFAWGLPFLIVINPILKQRIHDSLSSTVVIEDFTQDPEFIDNLENTNDESAETSINYDKE